VHGLLLLLLEILVDREEVLQLPQEVGRHVLELAVVP
jgi:hypothetical protein